MNEWYGFWGVPNTPLYAGAMRHVRLRTISLFRTMSETVSTPHLIRQLLIPLLEQLTIPLSKQQTTPLLPPPLIKQLPIALPKHQTTPLLPLPLSIQLTIPLPLLTPFLHIKEDCRELSYV